MDNQTVPSVSTLYSQLRPSPWTLEDVLIKEVESGWSVLDMGCGPGRPMGDSGLLDFVSVTGVDGHVPSLEEARIRGYSNVIQSDLLSFLSATETGKFDCTISIDVVEHFPKERGFEFLTELIRVTSKKVIIMTPTGFLPQDPAPDNPHQEHLSGWYPDELVSLGFSRVYGVNGLKWLRGSYASPTVRPEKLGLVLSEASQVLARRKPTWARHFVAVLDRTTT